MYLKLKIIIILFLSLNTFAQDVPYTIDEDGVYHYPPVDESLNSIQYESAPTSLEPTEEQKRRGVKRVTSDGEHIYGYDKGATNRTLSIRIGAMDAPQVEASNGLLFEDIYDTSMGFFELGYEWKKNTRAGVFGIELAAGIAMTTGNGRFADGTEALEKYTFYSIPVHLALSYRFQYSETQRFVPYASGGIGYFGAAEMRDDNKRNKLDSAATAIAGGGIMLSLSGLDSVDSAELEESYGVRDLWISLDYRRMVGMDQNLDYSGNIINLGIILDM